MSGEYWDFSYTWEVNNFLSCPLRHEKEIKSQDFIIETLGISKWCLVIRTDNDETNECCYFSLRKRECELKNHNQRTPFTFEIAVLTDDRTLLGASKKEHFAESEDELGDLFQLQWAMLCSDLREIDTLIVQCFVRKMTCAKQKCASLESTEAQTKTITDKCSFEWEIKFKNRRNFIEINKYFSIAASFYEITLNFSHDDVAIYVDKLVKNSSSSNLVNAKFSLLSDKSNPEYVRSYTHRVYGSWNYPKFLTKKQLLNYLRRHAIDGSITLLCEFDISKSMKLISSLNKTSIFEEKSLLKLQWDLRDLFSSKSQCDVKFEVNGGTIKAHKSVLVARSPIFAAMFTDDTLENRTGTVTIVDVEANILDSFLEYIYTGVVSNMDYEKAWKLLIVSDKYQVLLLMEECSCYLISSLSTENVVDIILMADMIQYEPLKKSALLYAVHHAEQVFTSSQWSRIVANVKLSTEIFSFIGQNFKMVIKISVQEV